MEWREIVDRIGLAEIIIGALAIVAVVLTIGAGFDFDPNEMIELFISGGIVLAVMGLMAALPYFIGHAAETWLAESDESD
jgi:hypothetical protein